MKDDRTNMKGSPWTHGPDEEDKYLASGECSKCATQLMSGYRKTRAIAIAVLHKEFQGHVCDPAAVRKLQEEGRTRVSIAWKGERKKAS